MLVVKHQTPWQHTMACQRGSNTYSKSGLFIKFNEQKCIMLSYYYFMTNNVGFIINLDKNV